MRMLRDSVYLPHLTVYHGPEAESGELVRFFHSFFVENDTRPQTWPDPYLHYFTPDAQVVIGPLVACGHQQIADMRDVMWKYVVLRKNRLHEVVLASPISCFLTGTVDYGLPSGRTVSIDWAARAEFADASYSRLALYRVYMDVLAVCEALDYELPLVPT